ncbi:tripartite motif-containing protein 16-like protein isoform X2 [Salarias fasciatus]|uniref:tripartite motif-containing protein 16-like protein isoform X2 n=1 Tax=Salarias fasciatus TaxID=181472 RepID=UPI0011766128|nr:tripartite motif-containing protein 16-like protein isoform X2 [Salarias fasciatus]
MAEASDGNPFSCAFCLDQLRDPVTVPCGHSFCMRCLTEYWDRRAAACPQCRATFSPRPKLCKNVLLAEMVSKFTAMSLSSEPSAPPMHEVLGPAGGHGFDHATFDVSSVQPEKNDAQRLVKDTRRHIAEQIEEKELEVKQLKKMMRTFLNLGDAAGRDSCKIFAELQDYFQHRQAEVKELILAQQEAEMTRAENHLQHLSRQMSELKRKDDQLKRLKHVQDQNLIAATCQSLAVPPDSSSSWTSNPNVSFGPVRNALADLKERIQELYEVLFPSVASAVKNVTLQKMDTAFKEACDPASILTLNNRNDLMQYFAELSFDPFTAHKELSLVEGNRTARRTGEVQSYPDHPDRFDTWVQTLCREGLEGRCYWEAEWDGQVTLGLAYESIGRKGSSDGCRLGHNAFSWSLQCTQSSLTFCHNKRATEVSAGGPPPRRVGVFLDHSAGVLCFCSVTPSEVRLLHRAEASFGQPLYPAVWLGNRSTVSLCAVDSLGAAV